jgi:hypothetical protein
LLLVQLGSSFELFLDLTLLLAVGLALAHLGRKWRPAVVRVSALVGVAYAACLPILVPIAALALSGQRGPLRYLPANFSIDLSNVAIPTPTVIAGMSGAARNVSQHFVSNVGEQIRVAARRRGGGWQRPVTAYSRSH